MGGGGGGKRIVIKIPARPRAKKKRGKGRNKRYFGKDRNLINFTKKEMIFQQKKVLLFYKIY